MQITELPKLSPVMEIVNGEPDLFTSQENSTANNATNFHKEHNDLYRDILGDVMHKTGYDVLPDELMDVYQ